MTNLIPFHTRRREAAAYWLALSTRYERLNKAGIPPPNPEHLGNLLQRLVHERPAVVFVLENLVAEMLDQLEP